MSRTRRRDFFDDGTSARPLVAGTVPRRDPREQGKWSEELFTTGKTAGKLAETLPFPVDRAVLERGQDRFRIFCTPCHGELGDGRGMIVQRGFNPPPSFHSEEVRQEARRPLFRRDDPRLRNHVFLCVADPGPRPVGDRGIHPGIAGESACDCRASCRAEDRSQLEGVGP